MIIVGLADPRKPLRDDVRLLGTLLGDTLREQAGVELFEALARDLAATPMALALPRSPGRFRSSSTWPTSPSNTIEFAVAART